MEGFLTKSTSGTRHSSMRIVSGVQWSASSSPIIIRITNADGDPSRKGSMWENMFMSRMANLIIFNGVASTYTPSPHDSRLTGESKSLRGTPKPPRREPWRLYFKDIETARRTASMAGRMARRRDDEEFIIYDHYSCRDLWNRFCHCFLEHALYTKYGGFEDADGGDAGKEEFPSSVILWLQSQVKGGHIPKVKFVGNDSKAED